MDNNTIRKLRFVTEIPEANSKEQRKRDALVTSEEKKDGFQMLSRCGKETFNQKTITLK